MRRFTAQLSRNRVFSFVRRTFTRIFLGSALGLVLQLTTPSTSSASGPVERVVQLLLHPSDPNVMVVRWGVASEGYLFSRDGGRTFAALCSAAIDPASARAGDPIRRISGQMIPGAAANLIDDGGHLLMTQLDGLWSDDGAGCAWTKSLAGLWPFSLQRARDGEVLALVNRSDNTNPTRPEAQARLLRRGADGAWTAWERAPLLRAHRAGQRVYGSELVTAHDGSRLYASLAVSNETLSANAVPSAEQIVVHSKDGGRTWSRGTTLPLDQREGFVLLGVDPRDATKLVGAVHRDGASDTLLVSNDAGASFREYDAGTTLHEITGLTFTPEGRMFVGDAGAGEVDREGGVYVADSVGEPLRKIPNTGATECVRWSEAKQALYICQLDKVGELDLESGALRVLVRLQDVPAQLQCADQDVPATCEATLNRGASWCCAGHYPFTPFCSRYDVRQAAGRRVFCGKAGQEYDQSAGRGPALPAEEPPVATLVEPRVPDEDETDPRMIVAGGLVVALGGLRIWLTRRRAARRRQENEHG